MHIDRSQLPDPPPEADRAKMVQDFIKASAEDPKAFRQDTLAMCIQAIYDGAMLFESDTDRLRLTKRGYDQELAMRLHRNRGKH